MIKRVQPRLPNGRFLSWDGTRNKKYSQSDIVKAYLAGLNDSGGYEAPSRKLARFMSKNEYEN